MARTSHTIEVRTISGQHVVLSLPLTLAQLKCSVVQQLHFTPSSIKIKVRNSIVKLSDLLLKYGEGMDIAELFGTQQMGREKEERPRGKLDMDVPTFGVGAASKGECKIMTSGEAVPSSPVADPLAPSSPIHIKDSEHAGPSYRRVNDNRHHPPPPLLYPHHHQDNSCHRSSILSIHHDDGSVGGDPPPSSERTIPPSYLPTAGRGGGVGLSPTVHHSMPPPAPSDFSPSTRAPTSRDARLAFDPAKKEGGPPLHTCVTVMGEGVPPSPPVQPLSSSSSQGMLLDGGPSSFSEKITEGTSKKTKEKGNHEDDKESTMRTVTTVGSNRSSSSRSNSSHSSSRASRRRHNNNVEGREFTDVSGCVDQFDRISTRKMDGLTGGTCHTNYCTTHNNDNTNGASGSSTSGGGGNAGGALHTLRHPHQEDSSDVSSRANSLSRSARGSFTNINNRNNSSSSTRSSFHMTTPTGTVPTTRSTVVIVERRGGGGGGGGGGSAFTATSFTPRPHSADSHAALSAAFHRPLPPPLPSSSSSLHSPSCSFGFMPAATARAPAPPSTATISEEEDEALPPSAASPMLTLTVFGVRTKYRVPTTQDTGPTCTLPPPSTTTTTTTSSSRRAKGNFLASSASPASDGDSHEKGEESSSSRLTTGAAPMMRTRAAGSAPAASGSGGDSGTAGSSTLSSGPPGPTPSSFPPFVGATPASDLPLLPRLGAEGRSGGNGGDVAAIFPSPSPPQSQGRQVVVVEGKAEQKKEQEEEDDEEGPIPYPLAPDGLDFLLAALLEDTTTVSGTENLSMYPIRAFYSPVMQFMIPYIGRNLTRLEKVMRQIARTNVLLFQWIRKHSRVFLRLVNGNGPSAVESQRYALAMLLREVARGQVNLLSEGGQPYDVVGWEIGGLEGVLEVESGDFGVNEAHGSLSPLHPGLLPTAVYLIEEEEDEEEEVREVGARRKSSEEASGIEGEEYVSTLVGAGTSPSSPSPFSEEEEKDKGNSAAKPPVSPSASYSCSSSSRALQGGLAGEKEEGKERSAHRGGIGDDDGGGDGTRREKNEGARKDSPIRDPEKILFDGAHEASFIITSHGRAIPVDGALRQGKERKKGSREILSSFMKEGEGGRESGGNGDGEGKEVEEDAVVGSRLSKTKGRTKATTTSSTSNWSTDIPASLPLPPSSSPPKHRRPPGEIPSAVLQFTDNQSLPQLLRNETDVMRIINHLLDVDSTDSQEEEEEEMEEEEEEEEEEEKGEDQLQGQTGKKDWEVSSTPTSSSSSFSSSSNTDRGKRREKRKRKERSRRGRRRTAEAGGTDDEASAAEYSKKEKKDDPSSAHLGCHGGDAKKKKNKKKKEGEEDVPPPLPPPHHPHCHHHHSYQRRRLYYSSRTRPSQVNNNNTNNSSTTSRSGSATSIVSTPAQLDGRAAPQPRFHSQSPISPPPVCLEKGEEEEENNNNNNSNSLPLPPPRPPAPAHHHPHLHPPNEEEEDPSSISTSALLCYSAGSSPGVVEGSTENPTGTTTGMTTTIPGESTNVQVREEGERKREEGKGSRAKRKGTTMTWTGKVKRDKKEKKGEEMEEKRGKNELHKERRGMKHPVATTSRTDARTTPSGTPSFSSPSSCTSLGRDSSSSSSTPTATDSKAQGKGDEKKNKKGASTRPLRGEKEKVNSHYDRATTSSSSCRMSPRFSPFAIPGKSTEVFSSLSRREMESAPAYPDDIPYLDIKALIAYVMTMLEHNPLFWIADDGDEEEEDHHQHNDDDDDDGGARDNVEKDGGEKEGNACQKEAEKNKEEDQLHVEKMRKEKEEDEKEGVHGRAVPHDGQDASFSSLPPLPSCSTSSSTSFSTWRAEKKREAQVEEDIANDVPSFLQRRHWLSLQGLAVRDVRRDAFAVRDVHYRLQEVSSQILNALGSSLHMVVNLSSFQWFIRMAEAFFSDMESFYLSIYHKFFRPGARAHPLRQALYGTFSNGRTSTSRTPGDGGDGGSPSFIKTMMASREVEPAPSPRPLPLSFNPEGDAPGGGITPCGDAGHHVCGSWRDSVESFALMACMARLLVVDAGQLMRSVALVGANASPCSTFSSSSPPTASPLNHGCGASPTSTMVGGGKSKRFEAIRQLSLLSSFGEPSVRWMSEHGTRRLLEQLMWLVEEQQTPIVFYTGCRKGDIHSEWLHPAHPHHGHPPSRMEGEGGMDLYEGKRSGKEGEKGKGRPLQGSPEQGREGEGERGGEWRRSEQDRLSSPHRTQGLAPIMKKERTRRGRRLSSSSFSSCCSSSCSTTSTTSVHSSSCSRSRSSTTSMTNLSASPEESSVGPNHWDYSRKKNLRRRKKNRSRVDGKGGDGRRRGGSRQRRWPPSLPSESTGKHHRCRNSSFSTSSFSSITSSPDGRKREHDVARGGSSQARRERRGRRNCAYGCRTTVAYVLRPTTTATTPPTPGSLSPCTSSGGDEPGSGDTRSTRGRGEDGWRDGSVCCLPPSAGASLPTRASPTRIPGGLFASSSLPRSGLGVCIDLHPLSSHGSYQDEVGRHAKCAKCLWDLTLLHLAEEKEEEPIDDDDDDDHHHKEDPKKNEKKKSNQKETRTEEGKRVKESLTALRMRREGEWIGFMRRQFHRLVEPLLKYPPFSSFDASAPLRFPPSCCSLPSPPLSSASTTTTAAGSPTGVQLCPPPPTPPITTTSAAVGPLPSPPSPALVQEEEECHLKERNDFHSEQDEKERQLEERILHAPFFYVVDSRLAPSFLSSAEQDTLSSSNAKAEGQEEGEEGKEGEEWVSLIEPCRFFPAFCDEQGALMMEKYSMCLSRSLWHLLLAHEAPVHHGGSTPTSGRTGAGAGGKWYASSFSSSSSPMRIDLSEDVEPVGEAAKQGGRRDGAIFTTTAAAASSPRVMPASGGPVHETEVDIRGGMGSTSPFVSGGQGGTTIRGTGRSSSGTAGGGGVSARTNGGLRPPTACAGTSRSGATAGTAPGGIHTSIPSSSLLLSAANEPPHWFSASVRGCWTRGDASPPEEWTVGEENLQLQLVFHQQNVGARYLSSSFSPSYGGDRGSSRWTTGVPQKHVVILHEEVGPEADKAIHAAKSKRSSIASSLFPSDTGSSQPGKNASSSPLPSSTYSSTSFSSPTSTSSSSYSSSLPLFSSAAAPTPSLVGDLHVIDPFLQPFIKGLERSGRSSCRRKSSIVEGKKKNGTHGRRHSASFPVPPQTVCPLHESHHRTDKGANPHPHPPSNGSHRDMEAVRTHPNRAGLEGGPPPVSTHHDEEEEAHDGKPNIRPTLASLSRVMEEHVIPALRRSTSFPTFHSTLVHNLLLPTCPTCCSYASRQGKRRPPLLGNKKEKCDDEKKQNTTRTAMVVGSGMDEDHNDHPLPSFPHDKDNPNHNTPSSCQSFFALFYHALLAYPQASLASIMRLVSLRRLRQSPHTPWMCMECSLYDFGGPLSSLPLLLNASLSDVVARIEAESKQQYEEEHEMEELFLCMMDHLLVRRPLGQVEVLDELVDLFASSSSSTCPSTMNYNNSPLILTPTATATTAPDSSGSTGPHESRGLCGGGSPGLSLDNSRSGSSSCTNRSTSSSHPPPHPPHNREILASASPNVRSTRTPPLVPFSGTRTSPPPPLPPSSASATPIHSSVSHNPLKNSISELIRVMMEKDGEDGDRDGHAGEPSDKNEVECHKKCEREEEQEGKRKKKKAGTLSLGKSEKRIGAGRGIGTTITPSSSTSTSSGSSSASAPVISSVIPPSNFSILPPSGTSTTSTSRSTTGGAVLAAAAVGGGGKSGGRTTDGTTSTTSQASNVRASHRSSMYSPLGGASSGSTAGGGVGRGRGGEAEHHVLPPHATIVSPPAAGSPASNNIRSDSGKPQLKKVGGSHPNRTVTPSPPFAAVAEHYPPRRGSSRKHGGGEGGVGGGNRKDSDEYECGDNGDI